MTIQLDCTQSYVCRSQSPVSHPARKQTPSWQPGAGGRAEQRGWAVEQVWKRTEESGKCQKSRLLLEKTAPDYGKTSLPKTHHLEDYKHTLGRFCNGREFVRGEEENPELKRWKIQQKLQVSENSLPNPR